MNVYFCILIRVKMRKIEHIGIAVHNLENSNELFSKLFGQAAYKTEEVASEGVKTSFFMCGPNKIELLEATNEDSPIAKFLEKKGEGIHHIAFDVEDIVLEIARLKKEGRLSENPLREAFASKSNRRLMLIAMFGAIVGQGVARRSARDRRCGPSPGRRCRTGRSAEGRQDFSVSADYDAGRFSAC